MHLIYLQMIRKLYPILFFLACQNSEEPLPYGHLRIGLPKKEYTPFLQNCPFGFYKNTQAEWEDKGNCWGDIYYPVIKARIQLTYKTTDTSIEHLLKEAQDLAYQHSVKADGISEKQFENKENSVFGMVYKMHGQTASNTQFYLTDSNQHFVRGAVYFFASPNPDSLKPVDEFMFQEVIRLVESFYWK